MAVVDGTAGPGRAGGTTSLPVRRQFCLMRVGRRRPLIGLGQVATAAAAFWCRRSLSLKKY